MEDRYTMSGKELDRYHVIQRVKARELTQQAAAMILKIKERQVRNLLLRFEREGTKGLVSKQRGRPSNHRKPSEIKQTVLALLKEQYEGFGPTLAKEKLEEWHQIKLSVETVRLWMKENHLWESRKTRKKIHRLRERRKCFGELIQADGSHHHWFGEELPLANANVFIDDATGRLTALVFSEEETLESYWQALEQHLKRYGRPRAVYTDHCAVFACTTKNTPGTTQMQQALGKLDIELILASSPQAKGRVERANRTLQDRLMKEFKLRRITTIEDGNRYVKEFIEEYNKKFSKKPMSDFDAHRSLEGYDLERILCRSETRTLSCSASFQFKNQFFQVQEVSEIRRLQGRKIEVRIVKGGRMRVFLGDKELRVVPLSEVIEPIIPVLTGKELESWKPRDYRPPSAWHPWRKVSYWGSMKKN